MKQALITGASSGIGYATAKILHQRGWQVSGVARGFDRHDASFMQCHTLDLSDTKNLPAALQSMEMALPDCLVLNAGRGLFGGLEQMSYQQIEELISLNLVSQLFVVKHFLAKFKKHGGKDIVLVGSEAALQGAKQGSVYAASKFALRGFAQSLRADCANSDVRVMLINPGPTSTEFFDVLHFEPQPGADFSLDAKQVGAAIAHAIELPRNTVQEEIVLQPMKRAFQSKPSR